MTRRLKLACFAEQNRGCREQNISVGATAVRKPEMAVLNPAAGSILILSVETR